MSVIAHVPFSKSLLNRAKIVQSWFPDLNIKGDSSCDDIKVMDQALKVLKSKTDGIKIIDCGLSATALRFLIFRVSREKGEFLLTGKPTLLSRPFEQIPKLLSQLGVQVTKTDKGFHIISDGWKPQGDCIYISSKVSSQYASGFILNSWNFPRDLYFVLTDKKESYPYLQMTISLAKSLGLDIQSSGNEYYIPKNQTLKSFEYQSEKDQSCLFSVAAFAALNNDRVIFESWESKSIQPDSVFVSILEQMNVAIKKDKNNLIISKTENLEPISIDLTFYPDLFPVLSVLCAKAEGKSYLRGIKRQSFKESNRLLKTKELLEKSGIKTEVQDDVFVIYGKKSWRQVQEFCFDTDNDHRMVMASFLVKGIGVPINIEGKESINKSFPDFLSIVNEVLDAKSCYWS